MSGLLKKIEFYKGESDHEQMVIAAGILGVLSALQQAGFFQYGVTGDGGILLPHQSKVNLSSIRVLAPIKFLPFPLKF